MAVQFCVTISREYADIIKRLKLSPSDCFKRGVALTVREREFTEEDNPTQLKEKISKMSEIIQRKVEEYELLKEQYENLKTKTI